MRYFLLRPETLFLLCVSLALWSYFFHTDEVKTIVKSSRDAVKMVKGKVAEIMQNDRLGGLDILEAEFSKTWEFKSQNVAVYSIQGRREHMEDRFEVITDLVNKTHPSIFGIFDGHGGESLSFMLTTEIFTLNLDALSYDPHLDPVQIGDLLLRTAQESDSTNKRTLEYQYCKECAQ
ncbi:UNVERIFIED_CONTAM: hypothetical protein FKN15_020972 [Acipenser sinensis]